MEMLCCVFSNQYSRSSPSGPVSLGVAENVRLFSAPLPNIQLTVARNVQSLMHEDLLELMQKSFHLEQVDLTYGTRLKGSQRLFLAVQRLYTQRFNPVIPIQVANLVTGAGVGSLCVQFKICYPYLEHAKTADG